LYLSVAVIALAAAGIVIGLTLDTRTTPQQPKGASGKPPVPQGLTGPAAPEIVAAFENWPHGSIDIMQRLGLKYSGGKTPVERWNSALVQYYRGVALAWAGYPSDAQGAWESAKKLGRNTVIQSQADSFLHPEFFRPGSGGTTYPVFIPVSKNPLLRQGSVLQNQGHQISAERLYQRAARRSPGDVEAQVAAAIGLFDESNLTPVFSRLGPLVKAHPNSQIAHYYFGLLLVWTARGGPAIKQFEKTVKLGPNTELGKQAETILAGIAKQSNGAAAG
jgi:hypothetical protein